MSKDIIVLAPNGRRQKVHCTPDTSILQVLEEVCQKQGYEPTNYDLKHYNKTLDLTSTIRFSNLPNKATLEMVEAESQRKESEVTVGLVLEDGERKTGQFPPNTSLYDVVMSLAPAELRALENPSILYTRQEVTGINAIREKTLRKLGLLGGRAILRLLNKSDEGKQANVSAIYGRHSSKDDFMNDTSSLNNTPNPLPGSSYEHKNPIVNNAQTNIAGPSEERRNLHPNKLESSSHEPKKSEDMKQDFIKLIKKEKNKNIETSASPEGEVTSKDSDTAMEIEETPISVEHKTTSKTSQMSQDDLERRLKIDEEVTFVGEKKAIVFMREDAEEIDDLPDDFYELSLDEVRKLYHDLQQRRLQLENTPLMVSSKKEEMEVQTSDQRQAQYKSAVVRVQFPDQVILQGVFSPTDTVQDIFDFVKQHIEDPNEPFYIFTTPVQEPLDPKKTLLEAKFVPCVHMHFKWLNDNRKGSYLRKELYLKQTSSDAAGMLASKYRAPTNRRSGTNLNNTQRSNESQPSTSKNSKVPKWFKS